MTTRRPAITATCPTCGPFDTRASEVTRCPRCHRGVRIPAEQRQARQEQLSATQIPALSPTIPMSAPRNTPAVAARPVKRPAVAVQPARPGPEYLEDDTDEDYGAYTNAPDPALSAKIAAAIERAATTGQVLGMTAPADIAQQADKLLSEAEQHIAGLRHSIEPGDKWGTLRVTLSCRAVPETQRIVAVEEADGTERIVAAQEQVTEARRQIVKQASRRRKATNLACGYCSAVPGQTTNALFPVSSPAFDGVRLLCHRCTTGEMTIPGAVAGESIVSVPAEGGVLVDMHAVKALIETGRLAIERVLAE